MLGFANKVHRDGTAPNWKEEFRAAITPDHSQFHFAKARRRKRHLTWVPFQHLGQAFEAGPVDPSAGLKRDIGWTPDKSESCALGSINEIKLRVSEQGARKMEVCARIFTSSFERAAIGHGPRAKYTRTLRALISASKATASAATRCGGQGPQGPFRGLRGLRAPSLANGSVRDGNRLGRFQKSHHKKSQKRPRFTSSDVSVVEHFSVVLRKLGLRYFDQLLSDPEPVAHVPGGLWSWLGRRWCRRHLKPRFVNCKNQTD